MPLVNPHPSHIYVCVSSFAFVHCALMQNFQPHISLYYGEADAREKAFASFTKDNALTNFKYSVTGIDVVVTEGTVDNWKHLGRATFSSAYLIPCQLCKRQAITSHAMYGAENWFFRSGLCIDGQWVAPKLGKFLDVVNPANKAAFHSVPAATAEDVDAAVAAAKRAFPRWRDTPVEERSQLLKAVAQRIRDRLAELAEYEVLDNGKPRKEAEMDMQDAAACFDYYANEILRVMKHEQDQPVRRWYCVFFVSFFVCLLAFCNSQLLPSIARCTVTDPVIYIHAYVKIDVENAQFKSSTRLEPVGVCGLIIPWNYPLLMAAWKVAPCLAAGCTAVLKPSEITPITALELAAICLDVGIPNGVLNVVTGFGPDAGSPLTSHPGTQLLFCVSVLYVF